MTFSYLYQGRYCHMLYQPCFEFLILHLAFDLFEGSALNDNITKNISMSLLMQTYRSAITVTKNFNFNNDIIIQ